MCDQDQELYYQHCLSKAEEERQGIPAGKAAEKLKQGDKIWIQAEVTHLEPWEDEDGRVLVKIDNIWSEIRIQDSVMVRLGGDE